MLQQMLKNYTRSHWIVWIFLFVLFTLLTYLAADGGIDDGPKHDRRVLVTTACTLSGPLTGAIARDMQSCCLEVSMSILFVTGPLLLIGVLATNFGPRERKWVRVMHLTLWILGWTLWYFGGLFSFAHALS